MAFVLVPVEPTQEMLDGVDFDITVDGVIPDKVLRNIWSAMIIANSRLAPVTCRDDYRGWQIEHRPPPIPCRDFDWTATHPDFDGEGDGRQVWGATWDAVCAEINAWYEDQDNG